jgi:hypothetical protein
MPVRRRGKVFEPPLAPLGEVQMGGHGPFEVALRSAPGAPNLLNRRAIIPT